MAKGALVDRVEGEASPPMPPPGTSARMIGNRHMPHVWNDGGDEAVCVRCGAEWPDADSCP
jgi:hypothetical protein